MEDWTSTTTTSNIRFSPSTIGSVIGPYTADELTVITWDPATSGYIQILPQFNPAPPSNEMLPWDEVDENDFYTPAKRAINVK